jgi:hypothetical protein
MLNLRKCFKDIIERENLHEADEFDHYQNDEIDCAEKDDYFCIVATLLEDMNEHKRHKAKISQYKDFDDEFVRFSFDLDGDRIMVEIYDERKIKFYVPDKNWISCQLTSNNDMRWWEQKTNTYDRFRLDLYGIENLAYRIHDAILGNRVDPKFDRLFEVVKPALMESILKIGLKMLSSLYSSIEYKIEEIRKYDEILSSDEEKEEAYIEHCNERKAQFQEEIDKTKELIDEIQCNFMDECLPLLGNNDEDIKSL